MITIHVQKREAEYILNRIDSAPKGIELVGVDIDLAKYNVDLSDNKIRIYKKPPLADPNQEQSQPTDTAHPTMIQVTTLAELKLHNFCESKIQSTTIEDKPVDKLSYSNIMRVMYSAIGSADEVIKTTTTNIKPGKLTGKGFKYFEPMDFSCQGVDANSAAREILHMSLTHSIAVDMVIGLVTGDVVNMRNTPKSELTESIVNNKTEIQEIETAVTKLMSIDEINSVEFADSETEQTSGPYDDCFDIGGLDENLIVKYCKEHEYIIISDIQQNTYDTLNKQVIELLKVPTYNKYKNDATIDLNTRTVKVYGDWCLEDYNCQRYSLNGGDDECIFVVGANRGGSLEHLYITMHIDNEKKVIKLDAHGGYYYTS
jgi:hypothetical protein